ncbi:PREDICTED: succinate dehydrogenase assembly factor 1, mitochondrial [Nanorana parkeri]|uniref:succinate dehydrogenase assembly factor 1, mitochondrial n=1 Tax=Nanorana parkeri TaxID=125878 RepID=UPI0008549301|nr:PREDICTED: succinate dehydrogenase assembly factor 1, mitochondrial [Nanorana parkeri]
MIIRSNLQKQVLSLYKHLIRAGKDKPGALPRIQHEFRRNAKIPRTEVMRIEYLVRRGRRQLEQLKDVNTKQLGAFIKTSPDQSEST